MEESKKSWKTPQLEELHIEVTMSGINPSSNEPTHVGGTGPIS